MMMITVRLYSVNKEAQCVS